MMDALCSQDMLALISKVAPSTRKCDELAQEKLHVARTRYLEMQLLLQETNALSRNKSIDKAQAASLHQAIQVARTTQMLELPNCITEDKEAGTTLGLQGGAVTHYLGVLPSTVLAQRLGPQFSQVKCMQQVLPQIETGLASQVACLAAALCTSAPTESQAISSPKVAVQPQEMNSLLAVVPERRKKLDMHKSATHAALARQLSLAVQMLDLLSQLSDELQQFAQRHILEKQQALDQFRVQLATEHCRSLCHKLQVVELQIDSSVYTQDSLAALSKVRDYLSSRRSAVSSALKEVNQSLQSYAALGAPFEKVAQRYVAVHNELGSVQQSLATFAELERELTGP